MNYNIIEKARREICVLFSFCAGERHDADPSKPGQSAEKSELPPIRRSCGADAGRRANRESWLIPPRVGNITRISLADRRTPLNDAQHLRHLQNGAAQAPCRSVSCAPVDTAARIVIQTPPREPEGSVPWRGRPIGGYNMQIIKAIAFVIEAIMAIYWLLKDDRQRAIFYMILMLFLV